MARTFYPFIEDGDGRAAAPSLEDMVVYPARVAVYDDAAAAPRVLVIDPQGVRPYLEEITQVVTRLSHEQGGSIPFMVIREIVENYIHACFVSPTISILDGGNTIRFSDQGPGIEAKERALEYGTTSATEEMKRYIRGVGSGLPYAQQYMVDKGGSLDLEDNVSRGTVVTISTRASSKEQIKPHGKQPVSEAALSDRGKLVLAYIEEHGSAGPTDLQNAYGKSLPTWSRELSSLVAEGILAKAGRRYLLPQPAPTVPRQGEIVDNRC